MSKDVCFSLIAKNCKQEDKKSRNGQKFQNKKGCNYAILKAESHEKYKNKAKFKKGKQKRKIFSPLLNQHKFDMGRRKSKRKPPPKRRAIQPLDQMFNCPFCNHEKSCEVKM